MAKTSSVDTMLTITAHGKRDQPALPCPPDELADDFASIMTPMDEDEIELRGSFATDPSISKSHKGGQIRSEAVEGLVSCLNCGTLIEEKSGVKRKEFCSAKCRNTWWNSNLDKVNRKAYYSFTCAHCGRPFTSYGNAGRKYCSRSCYIVDRFGRKD